MCFLFNDAAPTEIYALSLPDALPIWAVLVAPLLVLTMGPFLGLGFVRDLLGETATLWVELMLATPVILWAGWPFFLRGVKSVINRSPNMFTLIAMGVGAAYLFSAVAVFMPGIFPDGFRDADGNVDRNSTRLNSSHAVISYAVFCLKKIQHYRPYFCRLYTVSSFVA